MISKTAARHTNSGDRCQRGCSTCGSPSCLALVRAETSPTNWMDLLDRQIKLISSGHWGNSQIIHLAAFAAVAASGHRNTRRGLCARRLCMDLIRRV